MVSSKSVSGLAYSSKLISFVIGSSACMPLTALSPPISGGSMYVFLIRLVHGCWFWPTTNSLGWALSSVALVPLSPVLHCQYDNGTVDNSLTVSNISSKYTWN